MKIGYVCVGWYVCMMVCCYEEGLCLAGTSIGCSNADLLGTCAGCDTKTLVMLCNCALGRVGYECVLGTINGGE